MLESGRTSGGGIYEILFQGRLERGWSAWLNGLLSTRQVNRADPPVTCLTVDVPDQAALRGLVNRLWDLNLTLQAIRRIRAVPYQEKDHGC